MKRGDKLSADERRRVSNAASPVSKRDHVTVWVLFCFAHLIAKIRSASTQRKFTQCQDAMGLVLIKVGSQLGDAGLDDVGLESWSFVIWKVLADVAEEALVGCDVVDAEDCAKHSAGSADEGLADLSVVARGEVTDDGETVGGRGEGRELVRDEH